MSIEPPRPDESRIKGLCEVGCGDDDDGLVGAEPIELGEELVERLLAGGTFASERGVLKDHDN